MKEKMMVKKQQKETTFKDVAKVFAKWFLLTSVGIAIVAAGKILLGKRKK